MIAPKTRKARQAVAQLAGRLCGCFQPVDGRISNPRMPGQLYNHGIGTDTLTGAMNPEPRRSFRFTSYPSNELPGRVIRDYRRALAPVRFFPPLLTAWPAPLRLLLGVLLIFGAASPQEAEPGLTLTGQAVSPGPDGESFAVQGATMELMSVSEAAAEGEAPTLAETNEVGIFRFRNVAEGCYIVVGETEGLRGQSDIICLPLLEESDRITVRMEVKVVVQSVEVTASVIEIDPTETSSKGSVGVSTLYNAPKANRSFEDVMPLIPGVLRGPSGEINMNGARASQSGMQLNGADVTDPVTRTSQITLPIETVSSVEVLSSPYDAQYGGFTGAISTVETKPSNWSKYKVSLQNFTPRIRRRDGAIMGIESSTPRFTITGPIKKDKLAFLHSTEYQFVRADQEDANLPLLERDTERETLSSFTQIDARHSESNNTTVTLLYFPEKLNFFGLDAFTPQKSTPDLRRRGRLGTLSNTHQFASGASLSSRLSYQDLDNDVKPLIFEPAEIGLERARGAFFNRQRRNAVRRAWSERYNFAPVDGLGRHQVKTGVALADEDYRGDQIFSPVRWLGIGDRQVSRTDFTPAAEVRAGKTDFAVFVQDKWEVSSALTLDLGFRLERDSIARRSNPSYRAGFAYAIGEEAKTVFRGGAGLFIDRVSLIVPTFLQLPQRTETRYGPEGQITSERFFDHRFGGPIRNARSLGWSLQLDREVIPDLFLRGGYQQRSTTDNFLIEPETQAGLLPAALNQNYLTLSNRGRDTYREWQFTARYRLLGSGHITASYVRSSAVGDLNDLGSIYGPTPSALIRANERAPLIFDVPNRFLVWTEFPVPWGLRAVPVFELRDGFPYSNIDENRDFVGARNRAGRFPLYKSLDIQVTKLIEVKLRGKNRRFRAGLRLFNLLNTFNPQDIQSNLASPFHGVFYRGVKRKIRAVFELGF